MQAVNNVVAQHQQVIQAQHQQAQQQFATWAAQQDDLYDASVANVPPEYMTQLKVQAPKSLKAAGFAETALSLHQTQHTQDNSAVAVDSVSLRAARVVAAKRKASPKAAKRAAKLLSASPMAGNLH
jgi:hypothetical protein